MKKGKNVHLLIMIVSALSLLAGGYEIFQGSTFLKELSTLLLGLSLFGIGFFYYTKGRKETK